MDQPAAASSNSIDPPSALIPDDVQTAETNFKSRKLATSRRFGKRLATPFSKRKIPKTKKYRRGNAKLSTPPEPANVGLSPEETTSIDAPFVDEHVDKTVRRRAVMYENQRGSMLFGIPRYSAQSLLPVDPLPYTLPVPSSSTINGSTIPATSSGQPNISLEDFQLPDENWRWLDEQWLVDMRSTNVQYDGFEYNWFFRRRSWRPRAGFLSFGGWVRRRRWVREMVRPSDANLDRVRAGLSPSAPTAIKRKKSFTKPEVDAVWLGDENDWSRYHKLSRRLRDARKVDLWKHWLGEVPLEETEDPVQRLLSVQETVSEANSSESKIEGRKSGENQAAPTLQGYIKHGLKSHGSEVAQSFVYNTYRMAYFNLLVGVGLLESIPSRVDWSSAEYWERIYTK